MILKTWLPKHTEGEKLQVESGEKPELWKRFKVRGTPTIVLIDRVLGIPVTLVGLAQEEQLDRGLGVLREAVEKNAAKTKGRK